MKKNSGQALVEFVLILPIFLIMIFCIIDFSRVMQLKNNLESINSDAVSYYENGKSNEEIKKIINNGSVKDINVEVLINNDYVTINLSKQISPISPGLNYFIKDFFNVKTSRTFIVNEVKKDEEIIK